MVTKIHLVSKFIAISMPLLITTAIIKPIPPLNYLRICIGLPINYETCYISGSVYIVIDSPENNNTVIAGKDKAWSLLKLVLSIWIYDKGNAQTHSERRIHRISLKSRFHLSRHLTLGQND